MLNLELSRIDFSVPAVVADASAIKDEGIALVIDGALTGGDGINVKPSTAATSEKFYGVSMFERRPPTSMPDVFEFTMPSGSDYTGLTDGDEVAELPNTPSDLIVFDDDTQITQDATDNTTLGLVITGKSITIDKSGDTNRYRPAATTAVAAGSKIRIQYTYTPTVTQQVALVGTSIDLTPLGAGAQVTCVRKGIIFTSLYETQRVYSIGEGVKTVASGKFADSGGTGTSIETDRAVVVHVPSVATPFLGIELL